MRDSSREDDYGGWPPYVSVDERRRRAAAEVAKLRKKGRDVSPVTIEGRLIARTFWAKAWCDHLESFSDYANRLPRGRTYVRNGSVVDLQIERGKVTALVQGSSMYRITIEVTPADPKHWKSIVTACSGQIDSVVELLLGKLSDGVMHIITDKITGLFPAPRQIALRCSCPDSAGMCKHVAAALYGVGARFDASPELLFLLRGTDPAELVTAAAKGKVLRGSRAAAKREGLGDADLASVFGIEIDSGAEAPQAPRKRVRSAGFARDVAVAPKSVAPPPQKAPTPAQTKGRAKAAPSRKVAAATSAKGRGSEPSAKRTLSEFRRLGVPDETVAFWVRTGVLATTSRTGVYLEAKPERLGKYRAKP